MSKYFIYAPVDYIVGHLRYGHFEGIIDLEDEEIDDKEKLEDLIRDNCELLIDDWEIDDYGSFDMDGLELRRIKNEE